MADTSKKVKNKMDKLMKTAVEKAKVKKRTTEKGKGKSSEAKKNKKIKK